MTIYQIDYLPEKTAFPIDFIESNLELKKLSRVPLQAEIKIYMKNRFKLTDFFEGDLSNENYYFVSDRLKNIFSINNNPGLEFFPVEVFHKKNKYSYYVLNFLEDMSENIDFVNINFSLLNKITGQKIMDYKLKNLKEYISKANKISGLHEIKFENDLIKFESQLTKIPKIISLDLFLSGRIGITEEIKNKLMEDKITGVRFVCEKKIGVDIF